MGINFFREEHNCFACGRHHSCIDSMWYDKDQNIFCSYWVYTTDEGTNKYGYEKCPAKIQLDDELNQMVTYWNGKLHLLQYYTDG